ncbi:MAG: hypothetical protein ABSF28_05840 [Terracidiphilus sp.]|jgi:hypothetical protein
MIAFSQAAIIGLFIGFLWGTGCSLAILYSIYLGGYRKAVEDFLKEEKSKRWRETLKKVGAKRAADAPTVPKPTEVP